jgi:hypothetical protein
MLRKRFTIHKILGFSIFVNKTIGGRLGNKRLFLCNEETYLMCSKSCAKKLLSVEFGQPLVFEIRFLLERLTGDASDFS